jgi:hypothetical protein
MRLVMMKEEEKMYLYSFLTKSLVAGIVSSCSLSGGTE